MRAHAWIFFFFCSLGLDNLSHYILRERENRVAGAPLWVGLLNQLIRTRNRRLHSSYFQSRKGLYNARLAVAAKETQTVRSTLQFKEKILRSAKKT